MSSHYFFNAAIQLPQGSNIALENTLGNKVYLDSNSSMLSSYNLVLPSSAGLNGQALITDGNGNLYFDNVTNEITSLSSNIISNSVSGDLLFTTDLGNTTISANGIDTTLSLLNNNDGAGIIISSKQNKPIDTNDLSNISVLIRETECNVLSNLNVLGNLVVLNNSLIELFKINNLTGSLESNTSVTSNSSTTGAIVLRNNGGLGVGGNVNIAQRLTVNGISTINNSTNSNTFNDGSLVVTGGVGIAKDLNIGGSLNLTSNLDVTGRTLLDGFTSINNKFLLGIDIFNDSTILITDLWNGSNTATNKHLLLSTGNSLFSSSGNYDNGLMLNLFFTNTNNATANIDFGLSKLYCGSGTARYLVFNQTGQSASLVYIDDQVSGTSGWRIINTGGQIY